LAVLADFLKARDTTAVLGDTLSYIRGKHSFKFAVNSAASTNNNFNGDTGALSFNSVTISLLAKRSRSRSPLEICLAASLREKWVSLARTAGNFPKVDPGAWSPL